MADVLMIIILFLLILFGVWAVVDFCFSLYSIAKCHYGKYAYYVPTCSKVKKDMLNEARFLLQQNKKMTVVDLGSGTGTLLLPLAKEFPHHRFIGYEWDPILIKISRKKAKGLNNIKFEQKDFMRENLSDVDIVLCFVLKCQGEDVGAKLAAEINKKAVVIAEKFELKHLREIKRISSRTLRIPFKIFVYKK